MIMIMIMSASTAAVSYSIEHCVYRRCWLGAGGPLSQTKGFIMMGSWGGLDK